MRHHVMFALVVAGLLASLAGCQSSATADPSRPIVGKWRAASGSYPVVSEIRRDGLYVQRVGYRMTKPRTWRTEGDVLIVEQGPEDATRWQYKVEGDQLTLIRQLDEGTVAPEVYRRVR